MKKEQKEFFNLLDEFRKLNIGSMLPNICHGDACIMKAIGEAQKKKDHDQCIRVADIIEEMQVPPPAVSRGLRSLEERRFISRHVDEKDRRNTFVELTEEGRLLSEEIEHIMSDFADTVFERVGAESFEQLNQSMRILVNASREEIEKRKNTKKKTKGEKEWEKS